MEMLNAKYCRDTLVQFLWCIAIMSENQTRCGSDDRVQSEFFDLTTGGVGYLCDFNSRSGITIASTLRPSAKSGPERIAT